MGSGSTHLDPDSHMMWFCRTPRLFLECTKIPRQLTRSNRIFAITLCSNSNWLSTLLPWKSHKPSPGPPGPPQNCSCRTASKIAMGQWCAPKHHFTQERTLHGHSHNLVYLRKCESCTFSVKIYFVIRLSADFTVSKKCNAFNKFIFTFYHNVGMCLNAKSVYMYKWSTRTGLQNVRTVRRYVRTYIRTEKRFSSFNQVD